MPEELVVAGSFDTMRSHITEQLSRISSENGIRHTALKEYTDEGFNALRRSLDQFRAEFHDYIAALHAEVDRRFLEARLEVQTAAGFQQRAVDAALISAEKAVDKANDAADKRFDGVNEFRGQLTDQAATFISRNEYNAAYQALTDKLDTVDKRVTTGLVALELRLSSRLDVSSGHDSGSQEYRTERRLDVGQALQAFAVLVSIVAIIIVIILHK